MKNNWLNGLSKSTKGNFTLDGMAICKVTHPNMPNTSGHARGRKIHLSRDGKVSLCNMQVDFFYNTDTWATKNKCQICYKQYI